MKSTICDTNGIATRSDARACAAARAAVRGCRRSECAARPTCQSGPSVAAVSAVLFLLCVMLTTRLAANWPQFRGPDGQGHSTAEGIPLRWSEEESVIWKTPIPGQGWSSPVIWGSQVWMTSAVDEGKSLHAVCVDRASGRLLHDIEVLRPAAAGPRHTLNGFASPTPVLDGKHVFVHFGARGTACLDTAGHLVWKNTSLPFTAPQGAASSPILHGDLLILVCDGTDHQFVVALDKRTGKIVWKQARQHLERAFARNPFFQMAYSTPLVQDIDGTPQLVATCADHVAGYDAATGKELWWMPYEGCSLVGRPSYGNGMFYVVGSIKLDHHAVYAVRPGQGQLKTEQVAWQNSVGMPHVPSPLLLGKELFVVKDSGTATCLDALTGKVVWKNRLGGNFRSSPIEVRGRIYVCSEEGKTLVLATGRQFKVLATNQLAGKFYASPAVSGRALFLRSDTHLYRIED
ncbi:MAG: hypothetical protein CMJ59_21625 [Planctomycetaceae bacterium]|nr:hypothetical protein [Planctomycetaceae bacterium]